MLKQPFREAMSNPCRAWRTAVALAALSLYTAGADADEPDTPMFSFSGFGTLGLVHSSEDQADFTSSFFKPNGAGYTHDWSADVDSRIAAQITANFTPKLSAVLQVLSEQNYDNKYTPEIEWANLKYAFTPDFSIRAGRIVLPVFLVSDHRKVGYANPWVRPPIEFYGLLPISSSDGVDATYRAHVGDLTSTVQGTYGSSEFRIPVGGKVKVRDLWNLSYTAEYHYATVRISYLRTRLTVEAFNPLFDGFRQFGAEGAALADKYDLNDKPLEIIGLGAKYDPGGWFVMGEWGSGSSRSVFGKRSAWYASGGYRLGKFTPYLIYAQTKAESNTSDPGLTLTGLPPPQAGAAAGLNVGLNTILGSIPVQKTISVGGRWDFMKNVDLKLQYDHTDIGAGSPGTLINTQPGFQPGGTFNVFSVAVDFVF